MGLDKINKYRKELNMSLDELSEKSGVPKGTLSKITSGITTNPSLDTVKAIVKALGKRLDDLDDDASTEICNCYTPIQTGMLQKFLQLNSVGQTKIIEQINDMLTMEKYTSEKEYEPAKRDTAV